VLPSPRRWLMWIVCPATGGLSPSLTGVRADRRRCVGERGERGEGAGGKGEGGRGERGGDTHKHTTHTYKRDSRTHTLQIEITVDRGLTPLQQVTRRVKLGMKTRENGN
jgi:hypothetical protein